MVRIFMRTGCFFIELTTVIQICMVKYLIEISTVALQNKGRFLSLIYLIGFNMYSLLVVIAVGTLFMTILWVTTLLYK